MQQNFDNFDLKYHKQPSQQSNVLNYYSRYNRVKSQQYQQIHSLYTLLSLKTLTQISNKASLSLHMLNQFHLKQKNRLYQASQQNQDDFSYKNQNQQSQQIRQVQRNRSKSSQFNNKSSNKEHSDYVIQKKSKTNSKYNNQKSEQKSYEQSWKQQQLQKQYGYLNEGQNPDENNLNGLDDRYGIDDQSIQNKKDYYEELLKMISHQSKDDTKSIQKNGLNSSRDKERYQQKYQKLSKQKLRQQHDLNNEQQYQYDKDNEINTKIRNHQSDPHIFVQPSNKKNKILLNSSQDEAQQINDIKNKPVERQKIIIKSLVDQAIKISQSEEVTPNNKRFIKSQQNGNLSEEEEEYTNQKKQTEFFQYQHRQKQKRNRNQYVESVQEENNSRSSVVIERLKISNKIKQLINRQQNDHHNVNNKPIMQNSEIKNHLSKIPLVQSNVDEQDNEIHHTQSSIQSYQEVKKGHHIPNKNLIQLQLNHSQSEMLMRKQFNADYKQDEQDYENEVNQDQNKNMQFVHHQKQEDYQLNKQEEFDQNSYNQDRKELQIKKIQSEQVYQNSKLRKLSDILDEQLKQQIQDVVEEIDIHASYPKTSMNSINNEKLNDQNYYLSQIHPKNVQEVPDYHPLQMSPIKGLQNEQKPKKTSFKKFMINRQLNPRLVTSTILNQQNNTHKQISQKEGNQNEIVQPLKQKKNFKKMLKSQVVKQPSIQKISQKQSKQQKQRQKQKHAPLKKLQNKRLLQGFFDDN